MITKDELTTIAEYELARGASKNVEGLKDFAAFWFQKLPPARQKLVLRYEKAKNETIDTYVQMHEEEERQRKGGK